MSDFNWSGYARWENEMEWAAEPKEICGDCNEDCDYDFPCDCECHWTKENWKAYYADLIDG